MFDYCNVRVYDDEKTNLLKHWDNTYRYITRAKSEGSKVLVHCKMGVSRSASVVIAYAMKAYNWEFQQALQHVKARRNCIKPNKNFLNQLETYRGMLDAMKNKEKLQRSKSETNLKSTKDARLLPGSEPTPLIQALNQSKSKSAGQELSSSVGDAGGDNEAEESTVMQLSARVRCGVVDGSGSSEQKQRRFMRRSSSTSPKTIQSHSTVVVKQQSQSLENLTPERSIADEPKNVRFPGSNGENYSVTQNQVLHIQKNTPPPVPPPKAVVPTSVRTIIQDLETHGAGERKTADDRKTLNLPFTRSISHDPGASSKEEANKPLISPVWTSSAKLIQQTTNLKSATVGEPDFFSTQVDHAFAHQEQQVDDDDAKRNSRKTQSWTATSGGIVLDSNCSNIDATNMNALYEGFVRTRQRQRQRELPSRHASWGSGDQRSGAPMRHSSWGSYDTNRNSFQYGGVHAAPPSAIFEGQIHELNTNYKTASHPSHTYPHSHSHTHTTSTASSGTVKRTKQKLEECSSTQKKLRNGAEAAERKRYTTNLYRSASAAGSTRARFPLRCNSEEIVASGGADNLLLLQRDATRRSAGSKPLHAEVFSASAPESYTMSDIENKNMTLLDNSETSDDTASVILRGSGVPATTTEEQRISGNVQILKKNFEARAGTIVPTNTAGSAQAAAAAASQTTAPKKGHQSLPSSPVAQHAEHMSAIASATDDNTNCCDASDCNVKGLVHKYQATSLGTTASTINSTSQSVSAVASSSSNSTCSSISNSFKPRPRSYYDNRQGGTVLTRPLTHEYSDSRPPPAPAKYAVSQTTVESISAQQHQVQQAPLAHRRLQQHGKTHPLARLSLPKQSFNAAAYNTM